MVRTRLRFAAALFAIVSLLAGCAGGGAKPTDAPAQSGQPAPAPAPAPAQAKPLVIASGTTTVTMDIHKATDSPSFNVLLHIYDTLFTIDENGKIHPSLAESFKANEDGKSYTIKLRAGVKFSDNTPVNAAAVKKSLERVLDPEQKAANRSLISLVTEVVAQDELTVVIKTKEAFAPIEYHLTHPGVAIVAPSAIEKGADWLASNAIGSGPYMLKAYVKDQAVTMVKNPNYWGKAANIEEVTFKAVKEDGPRMIEVESGTADVAMRVPPSEVARLKANPELQIQEDSSLRAIYIYFNYLKEPFNKKEVRQAINYAIDKEAIVKNLLGGAALVADAPMAKPVFGYTQQKPYSRDVAKAKALLEQAGIKPGTKMVLHHPTGRYSQDAKIAEAVALQLKDIGLDVELKTLEWAQYLVETNKKPEENVIQMALLGWATSTMDADYALYNMFHSSQTPPNGGYNRAYYANAEIDKLLETARTTTDKAAREKAYAEANRILWDDAPWLWLHIETQITAVRKNVTGLTIHPSERVLWTEATKK